MPTILSTWSICWCPLLFELVPAIAPPAHVRSSAPLRSERNFVIHPAAAGFRLRSPRLRSLHCLRLGGDVGLFGCSHQHRIHVAAFGWDCAGVDLDKLSNPAAVVF